LKAGKNSLQILLATTNLGKLTELRDLISHYAQLKGVNVLSLKDMRERIEVVENQNSFHRNALKKAKEYSEFFKMPVIADDSGLVVPSLGGEPGIYSARYAGPSATDQDNIKLLLKKLAAFPDKSAYFESSVVFYKNPSEIFSFSGKIYGKIIDEERGANGFGYDPVFYIPEKDKTLAELSLEEKNTISHRKKAFEGVLNQLILKGY